MNSEQVTRLEPPGSLDDPDVSLKFPPRRVDERGRFLPISEDERQARNQAAIRALEALRRLPDDDAPGIEEEIMRGIDEGRSRRKLFEGYY